MLKKISRNLIVKVATVLASYLLSIMLARYLLPEQYGRFTFLIAITVLCTIPALFGFPQLIVREVRRYKEKYNIKKIWILSNRWLLIYTAVVTCIFLVFFSEMTSLAIIFSLSISIYFGSIIRLKSNLLYGLDRFISGQIFDVMLRPMLLISVVGVLIFFSITINGDEVYILNSLCLLFISIILIRFYKIKDIKYSTGEVCQMSNKEIMLTSSSFLFISSAQMILVNIDIIIIGFILSSSDVGVYRIAALISLGFASLREIVDLIVRNEIIKVYKPSTNEIKYEVKRLIKPYWLLFTVSLVILALYYVYGEFLIELFFGGEYIGAYPLALVLIAARMIEFMFGPYPMMLTMLNHEKQFAKLLWCIAASHVLLSIISVSYFGLSSLPVVVVITTFLIRYFSYYLTKIYFK